MEAGRRMMDREKKLALTDANSADPHWTSGANHNFPDAQELVGTRLRRGNKCHLG